MTAWLIPAGLALVLAVLFAWAFGRLPRAEWQFLAVWPREQNDDGSWRGVNVTYYGVFNALGVAAGTAVALFLPATAGLGLGVLASSIGFLLVICALASRLINGLVEGHWHGFTIGGASFVGIVLAPWLLWAFARIVPALDGADGVMLVLGGLAPAYALGEGIGRLACLSFGCCYGRRMVDLPAWLRRLCGGWATVFTGHLKKAAYAHGLAGERLVPVQAWTVVVSSMAGLLGMGLYLSGRPLWAYVLPIVATQGWRFAWECLRADHRGPGRITAYQWMALAGAVYTAVLGGWWPVREAVRPDVALGWSRLWTPGALLFIQAVALLTLLRMGLSTVTTARVWFGLVPDRALPRGCRSPEAANGG